MKSNKSQLPLETISKYGTLKFNDQKYILNLKFVSNVKIVTKIFNELVSISNSNFKFSDFFTEEDYVANKKFASYTIINIENSSIDGLILKFISRFKRAKRYDA